MDNYNVVIGDVKYYSENDLRKTLGIAEDSDILEAIAVLKKSDERAHSEMYKARGERYEVQKKLYEAKRRIVALEEGHAEKSKIIDRQVARIKELEEQLREKAGENSVLRDNMVDHFEDLAQKRQKALSNLRYEILKVYREIFDCSDGDPEGTDEEVMQDILTEYHRTLKLKDAAEEALTTVKESLAREREWTRKMEQKLIEIQDICER